MALNLTKYFVFSISEIHVSFSLLNFKIPTTKFRFVNMKYSDSKHKNEKVTINMRL